MNITAVSNNKLTIQVNDVEWDQNLVCFEILCSI